MKVTFGEEVLRDLYEKGETSSRKYKLVCKKKKLVEGYQRTVGIMFHVQSVDELRMFSFLHYESLKHQKGEQRSSVRLANGMVERLIFAERDGGIEVELIEIDSTHYGNKK